MTYTPNMGDNPQGRDEKVEESTIDTSRILPCANSHGTLRPLRANRGLENVRSQAETLILAFWRRKSEYVFLTASPLNRDKDQSQTRSKLTSGDPVISF